MITGNEGLKPGRSLADTEKHPLQNTVTSTHPSAAIKGESSMENKLDVRHISVSINRPANEVYEFASNPGNLPQWATGLGGSIRKVKGEWTADTPMGKAKIRFAEKNQFGILDHDVILESGVTFHNPMRVLPNGRSSEVIFTLFRQPDMSDEKFSEDAKWVEKDLRILKDLLEK
jgi:hypothetical protein